MKKARKAKAALIKPDVEVIESVEAELYKRVRSYIAKARAKVYAVANKEMVAAYWNVGREIVEKQGGAERAKYGDGLIKGLSLKLTAEFGPGYTSTNLKYMRLVFLAFPNRHTLCDQLSWSHYRTLASVENAKKRQFYLEECAKSGWGVRDLQRQISTQFYERLLANHVDLNKASGYVKRSRPEPKDIVRSPAGGACPSFGEVPVGVGSRLCIGRRAVPDSCWQRGLSLRSRLLQLPCALLLPGRSEGRQDHARRPWADAALQALLRTRADESGGQSANWHRSWFRSRRGGDPLHAERARAQPLCGEVSPEPADGRGATKGAPARTRRL